jgi:hypothetical protein
VIVVKAADDVGALQCAGASMVAVETSGPGVGCAHPGDAPLLLGKRYEVPEGGLEVLCTKAGCGPLEADGAALVMKQAKPLPSSD